MQLYTASEVAKMTGRSSVGVRKIAERQAKRGAPLGQKVGETWVFTDADLAIVAGMVNKAGRPVKAKPALPAPQTDQAQPPQA